MFSSNQKSAQYELSRGVFGSLEGTRSDLLPHLDRFFRHLKKVSESCGDGQRSSGSSEWKFHVRAGRSDRKFMGGTQYSICDTVFHESLQWIRNICVDDQLKGIRLLSHTNCQGVQLHQCRSKWDAQLDVFVWIWPFVGRFFRNVAGKCQNLRWIRTFAANLSCQHSTRGGWGKEKATSTYRGHTGAEFYRRALFLRDSNRF